MTNMFKLDWNNKEVVINFAKSMGKGMTVFKREGRDNYNITHTERTDLYSEDEVIFRT